MARKTQSQEIIDTGVMVSGIKAHQDVLALRKIDNAFADKLQAKVDACIKLNDEQETLKARLKEKTEELDAVLAVNCKWGTALAHFGSEKKQKIAENLVHSGEKEKIRIVVFVWKVE